MRQGMRKLVVRKGKLHHFMTKWLGECNDHKLIIPQQCTDYLRVDFSFSTGSFITEHIHTCPHSLPHKGCCHVMCCPLQASSVSLLKTDPCHYEFRVFVREQVTHKHTHQGTKRQSVIAHSV